MAYETAHKAPIVPPLRYSTSDQRSQCLIIQAVHKENAKGKKKETSETQAELHLHFSLTRSSHRVHRRPSQSPLRKSSLQNEPTGSLAPLDLLKYAFWCGVCPHSELCWTPVGTVWTPHMQRGRSFVRPRGDFSEWTTECKHNFSVVYKKNEGGHFAAIVVGVERRWDCLRAGKKHNRTCSRVQRRHISHDSVSCVWEAVNQSVHYLEDGGLSENVKRFGGRTGRLTDEK